MRGDQEDKEGRQQVVVGDTSTANQVGDAVEEALRCRDQAGGATAAPVSQL